MMNSGEQLIQMLLRLDIALCDRSAPPSEAAIQAFRELNGALRKYLGAPATSVAA